MLDLFLKYLFDFLKTTTVLVICLTIIALYFLLILVVPVILIVFIFKGITILWIPLILWYLIFALLNTKRGK